MNAGERRAAARRSAPPRRSPVTIDAARAPTAALPSLFSPFRGDRETPASASPPSGRSGGRIAAPRLDRLRIPVLIAGYWARSSAGERSSHTREAAGSNPAAPTIGCARTPGAKPFRLSPRNACGRLRRWMQRRPVPSSRMRRASRLYLQRPRRPGRQGRPTLSTHPPARHAGNLRREGWTNRRGGGVVRLRRPTTFPLLVPGGDRGDRRGSTCEARWRDRGDRGAGDTLGRNHVALTWTLGRLARLQRRGARGRKGSNRNRLLKERKLHKRIRDMRADAQRKVTKATVKRSGRVACETLNVKGRNRGAFAGGFRHVRVRADA